MKKQGLLISLMVILLIGSISALSPHAFYGDITYSNGSAVQDGLKIIAKLGNFEDSSVINNGKYGYNTDTLIVESETDGGTIYFYLEGKAESIKTFSFKGFEITELNLIVPVSNIVNNNTPIDDGEDNGNNQGSSSGSSSSGGSNSPKDKIIYLDDNLGNSKETATGTYDGLENLVANQKSSSNKITGAVTGALGTTGIIVMIMFIGGLVILLIIVGIIRRVKDSK